MISSMLTAFWQEEEGQDMVEYALLLAFVALAGVSLLSGISGSIKGIFTSINTNLGAANTAAAS
jgi:Flp pilus assembly pilin Flp